MPRIADNASVRSRIMEKLRGAARRDLSDAKTLRGLCVASNWAGAVQTASHVGAVSATGVLLWLSWGTWWAVPAFMVHGALLNFLYAGQHELSHGTVFRTRWLNEWVGRVFGFVLFSPRTFDQGRPGGQC